jgi:hypothetical protein
MRRVRRVPPLLLAGFGSAVSDSGCFQFQDGRVFSARQHGYIVLHALWQNYPRDSDELSSVLNYVLNPLQTAMIRVAVHSAAIPVREELNSPAFHFQLNSPSHQVFDVEPSQLSILAKYLFRLGRSECVAIAGHPASIANYPINELRSAELTLALLEAVANTRDRLFHIDLNDDAFACFLPSCPETHETIRQIAAAGLLKNSGEDAVEPSS